MKFFFYLSQENEQVSKAVPVSLQLQCVGADVDLPSYSGLSLEGKVNIWALKLLSYKFILLLHVNRYPKSPSSYLIKVKVES